MMVSEIDKKVIGLLFSLTKDERFTKNIFSSFNSDSEKEELIYYMENNGNLSKADINWKAFKITNPK